MNQKTAILIFANSAEKEVERKSFLSTDVISALNTQTLKTVEKSGITYFHISEKQQVGTSFGERFSNAIEGIFDKGFKNVITIGNDTPHLKAQHLVDTLHRLEKNDLVLGPSKDGGFYLMGIKKTHFNKETFIELPWQTNRLHKKIVNIATSKNLEIRFLELLNDIDSKEDIQFIIDSFKAIPLSILQLLQKLFFTIKIAFFQEEFSILNTSFFRNFNKGSPLIFA
ncbi:DUF2064 domain-containing protein [Polaribacter sp. ALD11]|uniref:TIGR04282 family arsenosugar biosynthesis glycosyltransferase n=1 Tax=Polaribacter sp. ALD11 TaxID=2058137 RepID=UPI000C307C64|nr:DUF2064 domain-containing protein [Polaribacter sp. ALD11]AUC86366.1 DUF2064 domain-containing protein [Polaribacter sp. ALD11]